MAGVDPSIIGKLNIPQQNPLQTVGTMQGVQKGILENRLLGQQVQGKEALGRFIGEFTDQSGKTDWGKVSAAASKDPRAAILLPEIQKQALDREISQLGLDKQSLELSAQRWGKVGDFSTALMASKEPLTKDRVISLMKSQLVDSGLFQDPQSAQVLVNFATNLPEDDASIRQALREVGLQSATTSERIGIILGPLSQVDRGPDILVKQTSPLTGDTTTAAVIPKGRTPSETAQLVDVYDPIKKQMVKKPSGEIVGDMPAGLKPQTVASGPALGEQEAMSGTAGEAVKLAAQWTADAEVAPESIARIRNIRDQVGKFVSGPAADKLNAINSARVLLANLMGKEPPKEAANATAAYEEFGKLAQEFANTQTRQLGEGTDSKLAASMKATPNEFMSAQGVEGVLALMEGLQEAKLAKAGAWQQWLAAGKSPSSAQQFQNEWNKIYNPRVFQSVYMDQKQRDNMLSKMTPQERKQFQRDWVNAKAAGWIK